MLEACGSGLMPSSMMALVPPARFAMSVVFPVREITHPDVLVPLQSAVMPQKKKSVPPPILELKNSEMGEQRELVELRIWAELVGVWFRVVPVKPKVYLQGVLSLAPSARQENSVDTGCRQLRLPTTLAGRAPPGQLVGNYNCFSPLASRS
jgi:hypothetical protein